MLLIEIQQRGYQGGISMLRQYLAPFKQPKTEPLIRFETLPGQQLQIDFTTIRRGKHPLKAFVATLGYSRATFVKFFDNERAESWQQGLREAFEYFGGVPEQDQTAWNALLDHHYHRRWHVHIAKETTEKWHTQRYLGRYLKKPPVSSKRLRHIGVMLSCHFGIIVMANISVNA